MRKISEQKNIYNEEWEIFPVFTSFLGFPSKGNGNYNLLALPELFCAMTSIYAQRVY